MASATRLIIKRRRRRAAQRKKQSREQLLLLALVIAFALIVVLPVGMVVGSVWVTYSDALTILPQPQQTIYLDPAAGATQIYDASGRTLLFSVEDPLGDQREWIPLDALPDELEAATVLWEDPNFYESERMSLWGLGEALWENWLGANPSEPMLSITGRLVRNVILQRPPDQSVSHDDRALEIALIAAIEQQYSPEEILEWHLNTNYYGRDAYGIEAAARIYLNKSAAALTLDEAALLAAITTQPEFNPIDRETEARGRQSQLLRRMLSEGAITQSEFQSVITAQTVIQPGATGTPELAPDFAFYAQEQAKTILNGLGLDGAQLISRGGLRITTTLDVDLYEQADCALRVQLARLSGQNANAITTRNGTPCESAAFLPPEAPQPLLVPPNDGSIVIIDAQTGELLTMNGTTTRAVYQPGATLYPFVYLHSLLSLDYTAASMLLDVPRPFPGAADGLIYVPSNPDGVYHGPVSLRDAMGASLVAPTVEIANALNINTIITETANRMGINSMRDARFTLEVLERGGAISLLDVAYAYSVFAALGEINGLLVDPLAEGLRDHDPVAIRRIEDSSGNVLWRYDADQIMINRVTRLEPELAYIVNDVLSDERTRWRTLGRESALEPPRDTAVVTSVSDDQVDNLTVGYTTQLVVGVHMGRVDRGATSLEAYAIDGSASVWRALMDYIYARDALVEIAWQPPAELVQTDVCAISGGLPNDACETRPEIFLGPWQFPPEDTYWELVEVNTESGQRANFTTPAVLRTTLPYFIPPEDAEDWWRANNMPLPPEEMDTISRPDFLSSATILQPANYDIVGGEVDIRGSMNDEDLAFWQLSYGEGTNPNPQGWIDLYSDPQTEFIPGTSLATWDTRGLDGTYVLQLRVVRDDNTIEYGYAQVTVDNVPPSVVLLTTDETTSYRWPEQQNITLRAETRDNISVDRVEFYLNGQFLDAVDEFPYEYTHSINRTGTEVLNAVVYDQVNNSSEAEITIEILRSGG